MVNYSLGKIYKIECLTTNKIYYGSTCEPTLSRRLAQYTGLFKKYKLMIDKDERFNKKVFSILENNNYKISLVENIICNTKDELKTRETFYIKNNECINK